MPSIPVEILLLKWYTLQWPKFRALWKVPETMGTRLSRYMYIYIEIIWSPRDGQKFETLPEIPNKYIYIYIYICIYMEFSWPRCDDSFAMLKAKVRYRYSLRLFLFLLYCFSFVSSCVSLLGLRPWSRRWTANGSNLSSWCCTSTVVFRAERY